MSNPNSGEQQMPQNNNQSNAGSWSFHENLAYAIFIDIYKKALTSKKKMRAMQFFQRLSMFVSTRTVSQCRSHHQKVFNKFKFMSKITAVFKMQLGKDTYKHVYDQGLECATRIAAKFNQNHSQPPITSDSLPNNFSPLHQSPSSDVKQEEIPGEMQQQVPQPLLKHQEQVPGSSGVFWLNLGERIIPVMLTNYLI